MRKLLILGGLLSLQVNAFATIRYVKTGGAGTQTGLSWANASGDLQLMINESSAAAVDSIWVAAGTYLPNRPANNLNTIAATNRGNAFTFVKNVRVFGGFPATGSPAWTERNWTTNVTRLSGNIGAADSSDNCYHVVVTAGAAVTADFIMDGFTISDGNAAVGSSMVINAVTIQGSFGAGWNNSGGSPVLRNLTFENNAISVGTGFGISVYNEGSPTVINTVFRNNKGNSSRGGAWYNQSGNPVLNNVIMQGNSSNVGGGGYSVAGNVTLNNATIVGNNAFSGGGWYMQNGAITLNNTIVYHNTASDNPGINLLFLPPLSTPTASYSHCLIQDLAGGTNGNLNGNTQVPGFVNPVAGTAAPTATGDYHLLPTSPCINTGNNAAITSGVLTDADGLIRIANTTVDMGAYEFGSTPLRVTIAGFALRSSGCTVDLSWTGENESDVSHYEIETAHSAKEFSSAGTIKALNLPGAKYRFRVEQNTSDSYYRIRSVDRDGGSSYSPVLQASVNCTTTAAITLSPNPARDLLTLSGLTSGQTVCIFDMQGKVLWKRSSTGSKMQIPVEHYVPGVYQAVIFSASNQPVRYEKVVVQ